MVSLPKGVGVVRIAHPLGVAVLVSHDLTPKEEEVGRIAATALGLSGKPVVILSIADIARMMQAAA